MGSKNESLGNTLHLVHYSDFVVTFANDRDLDREGRSNLLCSSIEIFNVTETGFQGEIKYIRTTDITRKT